MRKLAITGLYAVAALAGYASVAAFKQIKALAKQPIKLKDIYLNQGQEQIINFDNQEYKIKYDKLPNDGLALYVNGQFNQATHYYPLKLENRTELTPLEQKVDNLHLIISKIS